MARIINNKKHITSNKIVQVKQQSHLLKETDAIFVSFTLLHITTILSKAFFIQAQLFRYSSNPHSLLH